MKTAIYKSSKKRDSYLYIENEDDFSRIPPELLSAIGQLSHVMTIELSQDKKLAQANAAQVMHELQENGFYLQMPDDSDQLALAGIKPESNHIPVL
ncbi:MAG: YcgL domain-containing protein [gamma proteobacterium symbiont of Taylorina sp.]|nr:YcgL domain-containing protein [gamma proteobacterium symbiont of Taylorina sp.]